MYSSCPSHLHSPSLFSPTVSGATQFSLSYMNLWSPFPWSFGTSWYVCTPGTNLSQDGFSDISLSMIVLPLKESFDQLPRKGKTKNKKPKLLHLIASKWPISKGCMVKCRVKGCGPCIECHTPWRREVPEPTGGLLPPRTLDLQPSTVAQGTSYSMWFATSVCG